MWFWGGLGPHMRCRLSRTTIYVTAKGYNVAVSIEATGLDEHSYSWHSCENKYYRREWLKSSQGKVIIYKSSYLSLSLRSKLLHSQPALAQFCSRLIANTSNTYPLILEHANRNLQLRTLFTNRCHSEEIRSSNGHGRFPAIKSFAKNPKRNDETKNSAYKQNK